MLARSNPREAAGRSLARLYREHATATYRYALHLCGSTQDAEDLTQTAFLEAHRVLERGDKLVNPRAWLASVVRTRTLNLRRDRHEIPASDHLEVLARAVEPVEAADELHRIRAILWALPEAQHQAFVLRHWCDLSTREIAGVLNTTEPAVESLLVRARRAIGGADELGSACASTRERIAKGLDHTPTVRAHLAECWKCRVARDRLGRAATIASTLALVPRVSVAHSLAATVPGFTTAAATSVGGGVAAGTVSKGLAAKLLAGTLAVGATATAIHTGVLHVPTVTHHAAVVPRSSSPAAHRAAVNPTMAAMVAAPTGNPDPDPARSHRLAKDHDASAPAGSSTVPSGEDSQGQSQQGPDGNQTSDPTDPNQNQQDQSGGQNQGGDTTGGGGTSGSGDQSGDSGGSQSGDSGGSQSGDSSNSQN